MGKKNEVTRYLLQPRKLPRFGQDFLASDSIAPCSLIPLFKQDGHYSQPQKDPRLVISHNLEDPGDCAFLSSLESECRVIAHLHCQPTYLGKIAGETIRKASERVSGWIVPASFLKSDLAALLGSNSNQIEVAWNGANPARYHPASPAEIANWKSEVGIPEHYFLLGYVGRPIRSKGIEVIQHVADRLPGDCVLAVQIPPDQAEVARTLFGGIDRVHILVDSDHCTPRPIRFCDLLFMPSLSEVCPMVVIESLCSGVPVVATTSTPFYQELLGTWPECPLHLIPLSHRYKSLSQSDLAYAADDLEVIVNQFISALASLSTLNFDRRQAIGSKAIEVGLGAATMCEAWNRYYAESI